MGEGSPGSPAPEDWTGPKATLGDRTFIDAVIFRASTGIPWWDLPERFGPWKSVYNRFRNWSRKGQWAAIFKALQIELDEEGSIVDGSVTGPFLDECRGLPADVEDGSFR